MRLEVRNLGQLLRREGLGRGGMCFKGLKEKLLFVCIADLIGHRLESGDIFVVGVLEVFLFGDHCGSNHLQCIDNNQPDIGMRVQPIVQFIQASVFH